MNSYFLSVDLNLPQKLEVVNLKHKLGYSGLGLYFEILLKLSQQDDYILQCDYDLLAYDFRVDTETVKQIIENFDLFVVKNGVFFSEYVCEKMEELERKKQVKRKAGIASGMARKRAKKVIEQRSNSVRTEAQQVNEQKRTIYKRREDKINNMKEENKSLHTQLQANPLYEMTKNKEFKLLSDEEINFELQKANQYYKNKHNDIQLFNWLARANQYKKEKSTNEAPTLTTHTFLNDLI